MNQNEWMLCSVVLPENGVVVETKIDDQRGCRNETTLKRLNRLWFTPDGIMYVYYQPTHWRLPEANVEPPAATPITLSERLNALRKNIPPDFKASADLADGYYAGVSDAIAELRLQERELDARGTKIDRLTDKWNTLQAQGRSRVSMFGVALAVAGITAVIIAIILGLTR